METFLPSAICCPARAQAFPDHRLPAISSELWMQSSMVMPEEYIMAKIAGETRQDDLAQDRPEQRHAQLQIVELVGERRTALQGELDAGEDERPARAGPPTSSR